MNMRHHEREHDDQQYNFGRKQYAVKHINRVGADADNAASDEGKQQNAHARLNLKG